MISRRGFVKRVAMVLAASAMFRVPWPTNRIHLDPEKTYYITFRSGEYEYRYRVEGNFTVQGVDMDLEIGKHYTIETHIGIRMPVVGEKLSPDVFAGPSWRNTITESYNGLELVAIREV